MSRLQEEMGFFIIIHHEKQSNLSKNSVDCLECGYLLSLNTLSPSGNLQTTTVTALMSGPVCPLLQQWQDVNVTNHFLIISKACSMICNPYLALLRGPKTSS